MKKIGLYIILLVFISCNSEKKEGEIKETQVAVSNTFLERVEPPNWWVGFTTDTLQLLVKEKNIGNSKPAISYKGITINKVHKAKSNNYLFIDLTIDKKTKPGKFDIVFTLNDNSKKTHTYELKPRKKSADEYIGFNSSDAIYLITPDRFANGNSKNDSFQNLKETGVDRNDDYKRHGGDLEGIINHLDYIENLGFTTIWLTPVLINDMPNASYHGYAMTDYYKVDPRFGTLDEYKKLSLELSKRGMKLIMDQVANHCGLEHWWMKDLPFDNWVNYQSYYEKNKENWSWKTVKHSNHKRTTNQDLYASEIDAKENTEGWFVSDMPDLNQRNPFMAIYIIQNSIWWIETLGLGGIRQDTYPYPDKKFMAHWVNTIMNEYPNFSIVGEEWSYNPLLIGYWQKGKKNRDGYQSNLKSTMDFAMQKNVVDALNEPEKWNKGLVKIYEGLANDFHYKTPKDILIFPDNHDKSRIYTQLKEDVVNTKMALATYAVLPRILQVYYGTEILMDDTAKPGDHGLIRTDFPGGWEGDKINAFTKNGLSKEQIEMQSFVSKLLTYRKKSKAIQEGKTVHFAPKEGVYVLFRKYEDEVVVLILNKNDKPYTLDLNRFKEMNLKGKAFKNIITNKTIVWQDSLLLNKKGSLLLTTKQ
ncbi:glycoside hydrolase family 13 protein [uncultured Tenacibaculum sp.]|uniref:glycoside hydrolase family 13 protein n=1 Tax=uncultured Tenacibaculum sp. TaxID=174713 RepID=UPI00262FCFFB|nr:glycoside hydrolase family 13 protein [uncultured Tenacibaculum sp.]